ncbi:MAG: hypothetical protein V2J20_08715 [Wenzhouxiangella sp.]|nr:hypothetical protein [Wenzhouxiangella sp.]
MTIHRPIHRARSALRTRRFETHSAPVSDRAASCAGDAGFEGAGFDTKEFGPCP